jgi:AcrR family transcriptional regulator
MGIRERKRREKERRRQQIIAAVRRVLLVKDFGSATMADIAREAELSSGTLYLYFKNKNELYASLSVAPLQYLNLEMEKVVSGKKKLTYEQKIAGLKRVLYDVHQLDLWGLVNLIHLQSSDACEKLSPRLMSEIQRLLRGFLAKMAAIFEDGINAGVIADVHPDRVAQIV